MLGITRMTLSSQSGGLTMSDRLQGNEDLFSEVARGDLHHGHQQSVPAIMVENLLNSLVALHQHLDNDQTYCTKTKQSELILNKLQL